MAIGFDNPKVTVHIGDGFEFLRDKVNSFDIIITDASDPVGMLKFFFFLLITIIKNNIIMKFFFFFLGPAESLFQVKYFELMKNALRPGGIISTQGKIQKNLSKIINK